MGYAAVNVIPNIPTIVAPAIAGYLVASYGIVPGMRLVYTVVFFCMLAAALIRLFFLRETLANPQPIELGAVKEAFRDSLTAIREAWRDMPRNLRFVTIAFLVSAFEEPMFRLFTSLYVLNVVGISKLEWGLVNTVWIATTIILGFPFGKVVDKIGRRRSILIAYALFMPSTLLFILSNGFSMLLIVHVMFGVGGCLIMPAYNALLADLIPKEKRGRIMGAIVTMNILATVPASALSGVLYGVSPAYPFILSMILGASVSLIVLFAVREPKTKEE